MTAEKVKCANCRDTGWVCESHMGKPWEGEGACGCGGAGCNCVCNPNGEYEFEGVYASTDPDEVKTWTQ